MSEIDNLQRRRLLKALGAMGSLGVLGAHGAAAGGASAAGSAPPVWITSSHNAYWRKAATAPGVAPFENFLKMDVMLLDEPRLQTIAGFGACLSELAWQALGRVPAPVRAALLRDLFAPGVGLNLNLCRIPIGANDYARNWYSLNETAGDFAMEHFDLTRDDEMQVPFIQAAQQQRPDLKLWASPWSPPTWMKRNQHYAMVQSYPGMPSNGLRPDQVGASGQDMFIQEERYFKAYALYFRKFVDGYAARGIKLSTVMPQNEFNSAQPFPSCCWTPEGLARFIPYLGAEMEQAGVDLFFGTLERGDPALFEKVMADAAAARYIKGIGVQWAGRRALPMIHHAHPQLTVYQSEQECGDGRNDWHFARYSWTLMQQFMQAGASAYCYWNIATPAGGGSTWGWPQNALISIDMASGRHTVNPDYYVFKHLSHFVQPGARRLDTLSINGHENLLAFRNPDGATVVIAHNDMSSPHLLRIALGQRVVSALLPADSFNTLVL